MSLCRCQSFTETLRILQTSDLIYPLYLYILFFGAPENYTKETFLKNLKILLDTFHPAFILPISAATAVL